MEAPDDDLTTLARGNWILMQFKHGVTPENFVTLEELQTSSPKTYARIFVELCESASEEDKLNLAKWRYAKLKKRKPNVKQGRSDAAKARDRENDKKWDARMREEEARRAAEAEERRAAEAARIEAERQARIDAEDAEAKIEARGERREKFGKAREQALKEEDEARGRWSEDFDARLGARVEIYWELDDKWYSGIVDRQRGNFPGVLELRVKYNDGKYMWHPFYGKPFTGHGAPPPAADDDPVQWRFV